MTEPLMIRGRPRRSTAKGLLQSQGLPVSDITDEHLQHFLFLGSEGSPTGLVGVEIYGADALLRSPVVGEAARDKRLGYERIDRSRAPPSIKETLEFASLCPASSAFMTKAL